jgi:diguanylate cyclase (GGDEF)-like protein
LKRKDGSLVWVLESESLLEGPDGRLSVIEGTTIDITERKRAEEQVKHLAFHDPLTSLPNRLLFNDRLTLAVAQAHRHNQKMAVLFLDLDRFKVINDSLGHSVGDELLRQVAERIQEHVREGDTVARLGGDEFTLLVPGINVEEDAAKIARKICDAIHAPFWIDGRELFVTTSLGVSVYPSDGHDAETLVRNADSAMYRAKEQGRDNYQLYTPAMNAKAIERLSLESRLRQAVANDELELHFQPFIDLKTAEVLGAEALLRWRHPELGLIPPGEFIPIAELSGLIVPIGEWVLRTACAEARKWHQQGFQGLTVSVNLSSRQFQQTDLVSQVTQALEETGLEADKLDLEITESNAMQNAEHSINTLWGLKKQGVRISMDDFGTGYSSLNYLKRFPIDRIKLDQSFVRDLPGDKDDAAIAMAVIAMGRSLELVVIAEGVETEEQLAFLKGHECDQLQGFLLSRPLPSDAFETFLKESRAPQAREERSRFARTH